MHSCMEDTLTNASMVQTMTEISQTPCGPAEHRSDDSRTEPKSYVINYIDDSLAQSGFNTVDEFEVASALFVSEGDSCQLEVMQLPEEIFTHEEVQREFACIFHEFDPEVIISYSYQRQRAYLTFSDPTLAWQVRTYMNGKEFHGAKLAIVFIRTHPSTTEYLKPPKPERIFMQSPPTTPPIGWVAKREELPEINFDLFLALSKLQPNEPLEILPKQNDLPAIIIHPCSDTSDDDEEFGRRRYATAEAKRCAHILHDAILVPGEQQIRQSAGDGFSSLHT